MKKIINYDKQTLEETEQISNWMIINTLATIIIGVANIAIAIILLLIALEE